MDSWRWILDEDRERLDDSGFRFNLNFRGKRGKKKSGFSTKERSDLFPARIPDVPLEVCSYKKARSHLQQICGAAEKTEFFCRCAVIRFIYTPAHGNVDYLMLWTHPGFPSEGKAGMCLRYSKNSPFPGIFGI